MPELKCSTCHELFSPTSEQTKFIQQAIGKKMSFIMLECQSCLDFIAYNPLDGKVGGAPRASKATRAALGSGEKRAILESLERRGASLPPRYRAFLLRTGPGVTIRLKGRDWELYGVDELRKTVRIDEHRTLQIRELGAWAKTLRSVIDGEATEDENGKPCPFRRLGAGLSIGHDNEDVLFLDPADGFSVWCLFPFEGGTVALLQKRFDTFMTRLERMRQ